MMLYLFSFFFFFNDTATTEIYTLSLHDALPISRERCAHRAPDVAGGFEAHRVRSEEHTSELQSRSDLVCRLLLEKKKKITKRPLAAIIKNRVIAYILTKWSVAFNHVTFRVSASGRHCPAPIRFFFFNDTATTEIYTLSLHDVFRSRAAACRTGEPRRAVSHAGGDGARDTRSEENTSELQSRSELVCRLLLVKKN